MESSLTTETAKFGIGEAAAGASIGDSEPVKQLKIIPKVRKCGVVHFKNRFGADDSLYAVDVLESESTEIGRQMQAELRFRQNTTRRRTAKEKVKAANAKLAAAKTSLAEAGAAPQGSGNMLVLRIRVQSPAILRIMSQIMTGGEADWTAKPHTFMRPFGALVFYHARVCERLATLQERWGSPEHLDAVGTPSSMAVSDHDSSGGRIAVDDCPAALAELRAYVKFMSEEVMPLYTKFDKLRDVDGEAPAKVRFHDLWYLFRVGELVFRPVGTGANKEFNNTALGNRTWRCYGTRPAWSKYRVIADEHRNFIDDDYDDSERASFGVHCYYIDYTGDEFCVVTETFDIAPFRGEKPIKSLRVFPYRFAADHERQYRATIDNGHRFLESTKTKHASYNGWTTALTPRGEPTTDVEGNSQHRPEFIASEVIVDFGEALQACPAWRPEATLVRPEEADPQEAEDDFTICWWSDADRTRLVRETNEVIILRLGVTIFERNNNLSAKNASADRFLIRVRENDRNGKATTEAHLNTDDADPRACDLPLLPSRIFAYVLRDRKFAQLTVQQLKPVTKSNDAFDYLKINSRHRDLIQSLVEEHFEKKASDRQDGVDIGNIDVIKGKGKGLSILLYGAPGVGKTATAEAIAAANGKPLFPITCGDLGLTPATVERALLRIFRLADTWNCVLLLDEVDTFFSQRAKGDETLAKNALVSGEFAGLQQLTTLAQIPRYLVTNALFSFLVFLRVLEYYDGLLFLTTNRPGALDEAFKSRIHLKLHYPRLGQKQTMEIWDMNMTRLEKIEKERCRKNPAARPLQITRKSILRFAEEVFRKQKRQDPNSAVVLWNGRQIRNAFQVASSLAHYEARRDETLPKLTVAHFRTIHAVTEDFDQFMHDTMGKNDSMLAFERGERDDDFVARKRRYEEEDDHYHDDDGGGDGDDDNNNNDNNDDDDDDDGEDDDDHSEAPDNKKRKLYGEGRHSPPRPDLRLTTLGTEARRSLSPNIAAATEAAARGRSRASSGIFGSTGLSQVAGSTSARQQRRPPPPTSPRQRPQQQWTTQWRGAPSIEVMPSRDGAGDAYLSPGYARNTADGWGRSSQHGGRHRRDSSGQSRRAKRSKRDSDDDNEAYE
ncbi:aaa family ATPase [Lasiosphaeria ovina]|uniref:Aaa family ATPase n=1 Tax=Lasiosphaeria ovina TaxID=92902 RepID=A0AAE0N0U7_9PEZI|nr:aaa family ATPase [Lasiosphaeria ovina]